MNSLRRLLLAAGFALPAAAGAGSAFDVSLRPGAHGVYAPGETAELTLAVSNRTAAAADVRVRLRTIDYFGKTVANGERRLSVPSGGVVSNAIAFADLTAPGHYCTTAAWEASGERGVAEGAFVRVGPKPGKTDPLFGITCYEKGSTEVYSRLGVGTKGYTFAWIWLEDPAKPGPENCRFDKIVEYVDELRAAGIRVFGMVSTRSSYAPSRYRKAKTAPGEDPIADVPKYYEDLERFYRHLVRTFKGRIDDWACGEEIDLVMAQNPYAYRRCIDVTRIFARAARAENPDAKVFGASVSGGDGNSSPSFPCLRRLLAELKDVLDGVTPDQYTQGQHYGEGYENANSEQAKLRETMLDVMAIGDAQGVRGVGIDEKGPSFVTALPISSARGRFCADVAARDYIILKTLPRVRHWLYYCMHRESEGTTAFGTWKDGSPRQPAAAYAATARLMGGAAFVKGLDVHGDIPCWVFRKDGRFFATLWYNGKDAPLPFALAGRPLAACDVMGNPLSCEGNSVALSSSPVYVFFDSLAALETAVGGAAFDVPRIAAVLETMAVTQTILVVRNVTTRPLTVRVTDFRAEPACARPAALDAPIALGPSGTKTVSLPYSARTSELALSCGTGRPVRVRTEFRPVRVKRVASWEDLAGADEVRLDDPAIQVPSYADLVSHGIYRGLDDLSARARFGHDDAALWFELAVKDDIHFNDIVNPVRIWLGDSVQYSVDARHNARINLMSGVYGYDADDCNFCAALMGGRPVNFCYVAAEENRERIQGRERETPEIVRDESAKETRYRIRIPFADLAPFVPERGRAFGFSFIVFDHDPPTKGFHWMELTPGVASPFNPAKYKTLVLE